MNNYIEVKGARANNLKNIQVKIPRDRLIVVTGVSGSGKSSLAFDTLYAEGQRRYVESLSSYARQFLGRMNKPECDFINGLPPAIAIEQKVISRNPRSTVGTSTEIYDYLRLLFARIGHTFSPVSGIEVRKHTVEDVLKTVNSYGPGTKYCIVSPIIKPDGRSVEQHLKKLIMQGYTRLYYKGEFLRIDDVIENEKLNTEELFLLIDRLSVDANKDTVSRLYDSVETAFYEGNGNCRMIFLPSHIVYDFSTSYEADGIVFEEPSEHLFSFNSPLGACTECEGFGAVIGIDEKLVVPNTTLSVYDGCVQCWHGEKMGMWKDEFCRRAAQDKFPIFKPYYELSLKEKNWLWHGLPSESKKDIHEQVSIDAFFQMVKENQYKIQYRVMMSRYRGKTICPKCHGTRLKEEANYVRIQGKTITQLVEMPIIDLAAWFENLSLDAHEEMIGKRLITEIKSRLKFLLNVGLGYLTLNRQSNTLSGGESQRINLTTSLGSSLIGSLYILDEPSIGLHSRDTNRLIRVLKELKSLGNTVMVVEHDEDMIRSADYLIDLGPDAGRLGGDIVFEGEPDKIDKHTHIKHPLSYTLKYLNHQLSIPLPHSRRKWSMSIQLNGARMNNLKGVSVSFPLNVLCVVTGVSGSGKSSLVKGTLYPALKRKLDEVCDPPGEYLSIEGDWQYVEHVEFIDQNPIGKSTRSNPATFVKAYDLIRSLFAEQPLAKQLGFSPQYFSFNTDGGRCEECKGAGEITVEMQFMADLVLECESCHGKRFKHDILDVKFHGKNISDVLDMTVSEAIDFFGEHKETAIVAKLLPLQNVGLGYIKLGQSSSTLSGGENQRVKLAYFIGLEHHSPTLFIFDEPTTGLHLQDIHVLLEAFSKLIEKGHSIIVIEHHLDVIKCADYVIDLGPEGGEQGGHVVCAGTPEDIAACEKSYTGKFLKPKII